MSRIAKWPIAIVSGYFNPIHPGHISLFKNARKYGALFVIINNDTQVKLKGSTPFFNQLERRQLVSAIKYVSQTYIAIDRDDSVAETLKYIVDKWGKNRKIFFINGGDRNKFNNNAREEQMCNELGLNVVYGIGDKKVYSSSQLIEDAARMLITEKGIHK